MKFGVLGDLHFADQSPLGRRPGYQDQLFHKLTGVATILNQMKAEALVVTGDVFHIKRPDRVSYALTNRLIDCFQHDFAEQQIMICPGNHDLTEAGISSLNRQPLGAVLWSDNTLALIKDEGWTVHNTESRWPVLFIGRHFDTDGDFDPYYYLPTANEVQIAREHKVKVTIMVAHGSITPPGVHPIYEHITADQIPWGESSLVPDVLLCGHLHDDFGIHKVEDGPIYANLGSFSRPSRNQFVDNRDFLVVSIEAGKISLERMLIPNMLPALEVFFEKAEEHEDEDLAQFAEQIVSDIVLEDMSIEEALAGLGGEISKSVLNRLKRYLEDAGI